MEGGRGRSSSQSGPQLVLPAPTQRQRKEGAILQVYETGAGTVLPHLGLHAAGAPLGGAGLSYYCGSGDSWLLLHDEQY